MGVGSLPFRPDFLTVRPHHASALVIDPQVQLSWANVGCGSTKVGTGSTRQAITLTGVGLTPLTITSIAIAGADPSDFTETNHCPQSLAAKASCKIDLTFKLMVG
jgi:hypothetical protein